ncbi:MAG: 50S ribosomal protein L17 [Bacteroidales bacterium]|nr:50S ribosomal protein L17 [Bacteroidales bacterium]
MRHGCKVNHLSRTHAHRVAMLSNMATSLIMHKRVETTLAKAKALRVYVEPLINRSKEDSMHNRRMVFSYLHSKEAVNELFREVSQKIANRPGGYTRILKTGIRKGDNAEMCIIELVDYNENMLKEPKTKKAKSTRRGRGSRRTEEAVAATETVETATAEAPAPEAVATEVPAAE